MQEDDPNAALAAVSRGSLVRAATRLLGPADAEDAVQDAYVRALEAHVPALNAAQAWLLTVVRNLAVDRLRRRQWMAQWVAQATQAAQGDGAGMLAPSAEADAALAQQAALALRRLAACVTPAEGALVLLHAVFDASHAELAQAGGRTEAASRQQLRRALQRLQQARDRDATTGPGVGRDEPHDADPALLRLYLQSLQSRNPQGLWALLRQPPVSAVSMQQGAVRPLHAVPPRASHAASTVGGVVQMGGQLGLVLTLDGVQLCVVPLGPRAEQAHDAVAA
ncbi:RNA polymerase sigma factor [Paracidovorax sp. MALMAid1276]|uniref:RNA polymerase sigma factor n=1 Tax=Paracidovorax sp. MALMAid1276 TaxID=3411631 RepID=UPI003B9D0E18